MATHEPPSRPQLQLGPEDQGRLVSAEEFASADCVEPWKYEREKGRLVVMAPDGQQHVEGTNAWLRRLYAYQNEHPDRIDLIVPNAWVRVSGGTDRIGDIGIYLASEGPVPDIPDRIPDLMIEIVSPGRESAERDYVQKRDDYFKLGIREYIVADRFSKRLTVFRHRPQEYGEQVLTKDDIYATSLLPGLAITLAGVLGG